MTYSPEERAQKERFESFYARSQSPVMLIIERSVCGCDYGGNSWTTRDEAEQIAERLELSPGVRLLDLGAGSGWPGLYMGKRSGCDVTLVDLPLNGLRIAAQRAGKDGMTGNVWAAVADAAALPFADESFDAVSHSDLLCCLKQKRSVLAACRRVVRRRGRMVFTVITAAPNLPPEDYRRAVENGPEFIESDIDYPTLLEETGWIVTGHEDVTTTYADRVRRQLEADECYSDELIALIGANEFAERLAGWRPKLVALGDNIL
ncbi:MAG TPA: methyltransferase domain-containing protein, partial [Afifellaceae bacterium]|nr:methyltransferase domain-containing protein [Afifellaceae bacterium]